MRTVACVATLVLLGLSASVTADKVSTNPIAKVIQLISDLQAKVIADGEAEEKAYKDFFEWCDDAAREKQQEIKTLSSEKEELTATIEKATATVEELETKIGELAGKISVDEADLKAAGEIREKEHANFVVVEKDLADGVDALGRAINILAKHASLLQANKKDATKVMDFEEGMNAILNAAALSLQDKTKLQSLLQEAQNQKSASDDEFGLDSMGAPAPDAYKGHSGGIVDVLQEMLDKAEDQLAEARKEEMTAKHEYDMLKQSISDALKFAKEDKADAEKRMAASEEEKAVAEGDLDVTTKDLADAEETYKNVGQECMAQAQAHDVSKQSRAEELKALAEAKKILQTMTGGAQDRAYSFLQTLASVQVKTGSQGLQAVEVVKRLAANTHSAVLAQLAARMETAVRLADTTSDDPFAKVKGMIRDMIERLLKEAAAEASHKAWCDEEMSESKAKKEKLTATVEDLTTKIDKATADVGRLTEEIATLQEELAALAKLQAEMDKMRAEENETFKIAEADLSQGLEGVRMALKVLRDYYAKNEESFMQEKDFNAFMQQPKPPAGHSKSSGAAGGIIGMLEVAESDFAKNLAEARATEEQAQEEYDKTTQENKVAKTMKEQDVKYKNKERASLEKMVSEAKEDLTGSQTELDAVLEYWDKLKEQCIAKPEPYEERKKRREAEIEGLKEALSILEGEAFIQTGSRNLRGVKSHFD